MKTENAQSVTNKESNMTRHLTVRKTASSAMLVFLSLAILLFTTADNAAAALLCNQCHGNPPVDGPRVSNAGSSSLAGNHDGHVFGAANSPTALNVCAKCHGAAANSYTSSHSAYTSASMSAPKILMAAKINNSLAVSAPYSKGVFFNQTSVPIMGSCSNVNCHFETITPAWGNTTYSSQKSAISADASNTCTQCHAGPALISGKHNKHIVAFGNDLTSCNKCHPDYYAKTGTAAFTHATSNSVGSIRVTLNPGTPAALRTGQQFLPSASTTSGATCSNTYCHGTASPAVAWNGAATTCVSCHDALTPGLTLRHDKHISATAPTALAGGANDFSANYGYACLNCHPTNLHTTGPSSLAAPRQDADVSGTKITVYGKGTGSTADAKGYFYTGGLNTGGTCTTVCHTKDGVTAGSAVTSQNWGTTATVTCGVCHSKAGDAVPTWTAAHTKHINTYGVTGGNTNFTCNACHNNTATNNSTINGATGRAQHPDTTIQVEMNAFATGAAVVIGGTTRVNRTCTNTYCHGNGLSTTPTHGAENWTGAMAADCSSCHGGNSTAAAGSRIATNVHAQHLYSTSRVGRTVACGDCHSSTVSIASDGTITNYANHVSKSIQVNFSTSRHLNRNSDNPTYNATLTNTATGYSKPIATAGYTCASLYCHSSGNMGTNG
ncbi:MAG TPA: CxxxxCH/CxxCH domain-containing protein, partial [Desulfuromonadales bacterium]|nr:CxxxxCH/CxxCH domain-containing protein [Desulfuromonadales bacterium]